MLYHLLVSTDREPKGVDPALQFRSSQRLPSCGGRWGGAEGLQMQSTAAPQHLRVADSAVLGGRRIPSGAGFPED